MSDSCFHFIKQNLELAVKYVLSVTVVHTKNALYEWWQGQIIQLIYFSVAPVKSEN